MSAEIASLQAVQEVVKSGSSFTEIVGRNAQIMAELAKAHPIGACVAGAGVVGLAAWGSYKLARSFAG